MKHNYSHLSHNGNNQDPKSPKDSSIIFLKQFARVYTSTHGPLFPYCILN